MSYLIGRPQMARTMTSCFEGIISAGAADSPARVSRVRDMKCDWLIDLNFTRAAEERRGRPRYWVLNSWPDLLELDADNERHVEMARVAGDEPPRPAGPARSASYPLSCSDGCEFVTRPIGTSVVDRGRRGELGVSGARRARRRGQDSRIADH